MKWKLSKMERVWIIIESRFPLFMEMCQWLEEHVASKIRKGERFCVEPLDLQNTNKSILARLIEAQAREHTIAGIDGDVKMEES